MKTTKMMTKLICMALVLCMATAMLVSCSSNDTVLSMDIDGKTYTMSEEEFALLMAVKKEEICLQLGIIKQTDTPALWAEKTEKDGDTTFEQHYKDMILDQAKTVLIEKYLFDKYNLSISKDKLDGYKSARKDAEKQLGGAGSFRQWHGYTAKDFYEIYMPMVGRSEAVLEFLTGENGEQKVNDADLSAYYTENYVGYQFIMLDMKNKVVRDEEGNRVRETEKVKDKDGKETDEIKELESYKKETLTDDEKSDKQNLSATILKELENGTSFESLVQLYSDDYFSVAYPEGLFVHKDYNFLNNKTINDACKDLKVGEYTKEAVSIGSDAYQYIIKKVDLKPEAYKDELYLNLFEGFEDTVKYDKYENHVKTFFENVTVATEVADEYTLTDTYHSKYVDALLNRPYGM